MQCLIFNTFLTILNLGITVILLYLLNEKFSSVDQKLNEISEKIKSPILSTPVAQEAEKVKPKSQLDILKNAFRGVSE